MIEVVGPIIPASVRETWRAQGLITDEVVNTLLPRAAALWPDQYAVIDIADPEQEARTKSYRDLLAEVERMAAFLRRSGVQPGDVVVVQCPNRTEVIAACLAGWHCGCVCVPVVDMYRLHELRHILSSVRPDVIFSAGIYRGHSHTSTFDSLLAELDLSPKARVTIGACAAGWTNYDDALDSGCEIANPAPLDPEDPVVVLFTSGTTSSPKGAVHCSRSLVAETLQTVRAWSLGWRDRGFLPLPLAHIAGVGFGLLFPIYTGGSLVLSRMAGRERMAREIVQHGVTWAAGHPRLLPLLAQEYANCGISDPPLKTFVSGGTTVPQSLIEVGENLGLRPLRTYGMTEFPSVTASCAADPPEVRLATDGRVPLGVECVAVDPATREVRCDGEEGELRVRGPEQMLGYLDPSESAAQIDSDGWFYTGDLGRVERRCVTITGRIKDIINRGGEKFSARDIEDVLIRHPDIEAVAIVAARDQRYGEVPAAFVVLTPGSIPDAEKFTSFLGEEGLASQKRPPHWRWVQSLPTTETGKVRKNELRAVLESEGL